MSYMLSTQSFPKLHAVGLLLLLCICQYSAKAIDIDSLSNPISLTESLQLFQGEGSSLEAIQANKLNFAPIKEGEMLNGNQDFWLRGKVVYRASADTVIITAGNADGAVLYVIDEQEKVSVYKTGWITPRSEHSIQEGSFREPKFKLPLKKNTAYTFLIKYSSPSTLRVNPVVMMWEPTSWRGHYYKEDSEKALFVGVVLGFLGIMIAYNFFTGLLSNRKVYFYYTLYFTGAFIYTLNHGDYFLLIDAVAENPHLLLAFRILGTSLGAAGYILFFQSFLDTADRMPRWHKIFSYYKVVIFGLCLYALVITFFTVSSIYTLAVNGAVHVILHSTLCIFVIYVALRKGATILDRFFVAGASFFTSASIFFMWMGIFQTYDEIGIVVEAIGMGIEATVFSLGVGYKMRLVEKQKREAEQRISNILRQQNETLEKQVKDRTKEIKRQKEEAEALLLNILPRETAEELKLTGRAMPKSYQSATVLFTDFKGFTKIASAIPAEEIVENLHYCFTHFDMIMSRHGIEKIKTIGDAYMAVGGLPTPIPDHAERMANAAFDMIEFIDDWNEEKRRNNEKPWEIRLGIHTGRLVAGIVGKEKFAFDIWGDTVNLASRMESSGEAGRVNVSQSTYDLLPKDLFQGHYRGMISAKNAGEIGMYFLEKKPSLTQ